MSVELDPWEDVEEVKRKAQEFQEMLAEDDAEEAARQAERDAANGEICVDPITGEVIDPANPDHLIDALERLKERLDQLSVWRGLYEMAIVDLARGEKKTERVNGERRQVVIEYPGTDFDQPTLKRLWESHPKLAASYLRIERIGVQKREYDKLHGMSGPQEQEEFRRALMAAEKKSNRRPTVRIEK